MNRSLREKKLLQNTFQLLYSSLNEIKKNYLNRRGEFNEFQIVSEFIKDPTVIKNKLTSTFGARR